MVLSKASCLVVVVVVGAVVVASQPSIRHSCSLVPKSASRSNVLRNVAEWLVTRSIVMVVVVVVVVVHHAQGTTGE